LGGSNVAAAYTYWAHLNHAPFRLLAFMCLVTMDEDDPPRYWGGREALVHALGRQIAPEPAPTDFSPRAEEYRKSRRADFEAVKVAMRGLTKAGVVAVESPASPGHNAVYQLRLTTRTGKTEPVERGRVILSTGKTEPVERGRVSLPPRKNLPTGGSPSEDQQRSDEDNKSPQSGNSPAISTSDDESKYQAASKFLSGLEDLGQSYMQMTGHITGLRERVITAAEFARLDQARNRQEGAS
jgi:hypothetical protein